MTAGRPPIWDSPEELQAAVDKYFEDCRNRKIKKQTVQKGEVVEWEVSWPVSMAGLALALDVSRDTLNRYSKTDKFSDIIMRARKRIEDENLALASVGCHDSKIAALNLASNFGYSTKQEFAVQDERMVKAILDALPPEIVQSVIGQLEDRATKLLKSPKG